MTYALTFNILVKVWVAGEIALVLFTHIRKGNGALRDRGSLFVLWPTIWTSITAGSRYAATHQSTLLQGSHWIMPLALGLLVSGLCLRWVAIVSLGRAFSVNVAIRTGQHVKQDGLYRLVRHPSYTGMLLMLVAVGLAMRNWIAFAIITVPTMLALFYRIHVEERALAEAFGPEYTAYCESTKRLIPAVY